MNAENTIKQKEPEQSLLEKLKGSHILSVAIHDYAMFIALLIPNVKRDFKLLYLMIFTGLLNLILVNIIGGSWAMILSTLIAASVGACLIEVRL